MDIISHNSHNSSSSGTSRGTNTAVDRRDRRDQGHTERQDKGKGKGRGRDRDREDRAATGAAASMTIDLSKVERWVRNAGGRREANMRMVGKRKREVGTGACSTVCDRYRRDVLQVFSHLIPRSFSLFFYTIGVFGGGRAPTGQLSFPPFFSFSFFFFSSDMSIKPVRERNVYFI